jgi:hypothetical protein
MSPTDYDPSRPTEAGYSNQAPMNFVQVVALFGSLAISGVVMLVVTLIVAKTSPVELINSQPLLLIGVPMVLAIVLSVLKTFLLKMLFRNEHPPNTFWMLLAGNLVLCIPIVCIAQLVTEAGNPVQRGY